MLEDANLDDNKTDVNGGEAKTWGTNFKANGVTYATSLFWQPLRNIDDPFIEITEAAENVLEGADLFCIKHGKNPQFGLCISAQGYTKKDRVAAVAIANALSDASSFLAVFKVENGWWYVCVRNDVILSDGDMLFFNEEEAKEQYMSMLAVPDWGYKIAPAEWNIEDSKEFQIEELLKNAPKVSLQKIHALRGAKLVAVIIAVLVIAGWLISTLSSTVFKSEPPKPIVAPVAIKDVDKNVIPPEPKPWESLAAPEEVMLYCFKAVQDVVGISTPGWRIGGITCNAESLVTSWSMEIGRLTWIDKALEKSGIHFSNRSISPSGREVMVSLPLPKAKKRNSPPKYNAVDLVNLLNDLFQGLQMSAGLSSQSWTSPQNNVYKSVHFSFNSKHDPKQWNDILTKFSGLTINVIKYDVNNNSWYYEGAIYVL